jgi:hypothetical protein
MNERFRELTVMVDVQSKDKLRLKEFMKQELAYYNALVEGLGPRARTFPDTLLALHKDWENLWAVLASEGKSIKGYDRLKEDANLPEAYEPHRKMLLGKNTKGERFLNERMFSIMSVATAPAVLHPLVRRGMATQILEFYKEQSGKLIKRNEEAFGDQDVYAKPIDLLVSHDLVTKRHLQIPRAALNDVRYLDKREETHIYHPYCENPLIIQGHNLESNNHWNFLMVHQQSGVEAVPSTPWVVEVKHTPVPYLIRYADVDRPRTGQIFAIAKKKSY